jgi:hypothetical protein
MLLVVALPLASGEMMISVPSKLCRRSHVLVAFSLIVPDDNHAVVFVGLRSFDFRHQHRQEIIAKRDLLGVCSAL